MLGRFSHIRPFATPGLYPQAPWSVELSRQECWGGLPFAHQGIFPTRESNPCLIPPALAGGFLTTSTTLAVLGCSCSLFEQDPVKVSLLHFIAISLQFVLFYNSPPISLSCHWLFWGEQVSILTKYITFFFGFNFLLLIVLNLFTQLLKILYVKN